MRTRLWVLSAAVLFAACVGAGCSSDSAPSPSAPSVSPAPAQTTPAPLTEQLVGVWSLTMSVSEAAGAGCLAEAVRAQVGAASAYSLMILESGQVTLKSSSDALSCVFVVKTDGEAGFTTHGENGFYQCTGEPRSYQCADGTEVRYISWGQDIDGRVSGSRLSGTWSAAWFEVGKDGPGVESEAQFSGTR